LPRLSGPSKPFLP